MEGPRAIRDFQNERPLHTALQHLRKSAQVLRDVATESGSGTGEAGRSRVLLHQVPRPNSLLPLRRRPQEMAGVWWPLGGTRSLVQSLRLYQHSEGKRLHQRSRGHEATNSVRKGKLSDFEGYLFACMLELLKPTSSSAEFGVSRIFIFERDNGLMPCSKLFNCRRYYGRSISY